MKKVLFSLAAMLLLISPITGCALESTPQIFANADNNSNEATTGKVEIRVTDAPRNDNVTAIWVKVDEIQIHKAGTKNENAETDGGWISGNITGLNPFELLELKNGGIQSILGDFELATGNYTQIRLMVGEVKVTIGSENHTAVVPSGKIKFVRPFEVAEGKTTVLLFDFDAAKSVNVTPKKIIFKPVIKLTAEKPRNDDSAVKTGKIQIDPVILPSGVTGTAYSVLLSASNGTAPYSWALLGGLLPDGLSVDNTTSSIKGTPTTTGTFNFTIGVTDNGTPQKSGTRSYTISIGAADAPNIITTSMPDGKVGTTYTLTLAVAGGVPDYTWGLYSGIIPPGLTFTNATGNFAGTPTQAGNYRFTIRVTDASTPPKTDIQEYTIKIKS